MEEDGKRDGRGMHPVPKIPHRFTPMPTYMYTSLSRFHSPLRKLADRAIYFACLTFSFLSFFNDCSENNYLSIYWTIFRNLFTK